MWFLFLLQTLRPLRASGENGFHHFEEGCKQMKCRLVEVKERVSVSLLQGDLVCFIMLYFTFSSVPKFIYTGSEL